MCSSSEPLNEQDLTRFNICGMCFPLSDNGDHYGFLEKVLVMDLQSGNEVEGRNTSSHQTTQFIDENLGELGGFSGPIVDAATVDATPGVSLATFLSRPVVLNNFIWDESMTVSTLLYLFNPWEAFFDIASIQRKLDNYAFIRCDLKVKFVINASPFYYGSVLASYEPLAGLRNSTIEADTMGRETVSRSQQPHVWLMPQTNQGGVLTLPFFYHKNWLKIAERADLTNMGTITMQVLNPLLNANGVVGGGVSVEVFAWAENVTLMGPTNTLALQAKDEYPEGPISKPASAIATALGKLSMVPTIGPYMTASAMIASSIGKFAHLFGYTNVPNISTVDMYKPAPFPQMATAEISTPVEKLSLDPKNELSIDPRTVGLPPVDEMAIKYIIQKESYLTSFLYETTNVTDDLLFSSRINPKLQEYAALTGAVYPTPMSYINTLFKFWRGDIKFRFRVVCSRFHKGRLRITFDPLAGTAAAYDYSTTFNEIIDIGESADVSITIPYMQPTAWLATTTTFNTYLFSNTFMPTYTPNSDNGIFQVRVVTPLSAPTGTSGVYIQVFVSGGDNLEFALPQDLPVAPLMMLQSVDELDYSKTLELVAGTEANHSAPQRYLLNMGENIVSLRQLLRRQAYSLTLNAATNTASQYVLWRHIANRYPPYLGTYTNAVNTTVAAAPFTYTKVTPYNWLAPMYVAQRGSMVWTINPDSSGRVGGIGNFSAKRTVNTTNATFWNTSTNFAAGLTSSGYSHGLLTNRISGNSGMSLINQDTQTGFSICCPDFNRFNFRIINPVLCVEGTSIDDTNTDNIQVEAILKPTSNSVTTNNIYLDKYYSIGPDFSFFFFLNAPCYTVITLPSPAV